jgi:pimeloyl-ACP methyl ester carboxylesterase
MYAHLYPDNIRTMILDAVVDHSLSEVVFSASEAASYSITQRRMFDWMSKNSSSALHGRDVAVEFSDLVQRLDDKPIAIQECVESGACLPDLTGDSIRHATFSPVNNPNQWLSYALSLKQVIDDDNATSIAYPISDADTGTGNSMWGIACQDYQWPDTWTQFRDLQYVHASYSPGPGGPVGARLWSLGCPRWPTEVTNPVSSLRTKNISAPIMIVNALWDPVTGIDQALNMHHQLEGSVLVTRYGEGHGSFGWPVTKAVMDRYFIDVEVPETGTMLVDSPVSHMKTDFERLGLNAAGA